jgi:eukaryotic-like serine/threonine-protein kinase
MNCLYRFSYSPYCRVITLSLLHPVKQTPVQVWSFPNESVVRIGRSSDNQVVLYSAVVSRYHVELRRNGALWEVVNVGTNGTYLDGKRINQMTIADGAVIRLARSGPNIQVNLGDVPTSLIATTPALSTPALSTAAASEEMPLTSTET